MTMNLSEVEARMENTKPCATHIYLRSENYRMVANIGFGEIFVISTFPADVSNDKVGTMCTSIFLQISCLLIYTVVFVCIQN